MDTAAACAGRSYLLRNIRDQINFPCRTIPSLADRAGQACGAKGDSGDLGDFSQDITRIRTLEMLLRE